MKPVRRCAFACVVALTASCAPTPVSPEAPDASKAELLRLGGGWQSTWQVVSWKQAGVEVISPSGPEHLLVFAPDGTFKWLRDKELVAKGKAVRLDPSKQPKEIDCAFTYGANAGESDRAIYQLDGDALTECSAPAGRPRPTEFKSTKENGWSLTTYKRIERLDRFDDAKKQ